MGHRKGLFEVSITTISYGVKKVCGGPIERPNRADIHAVGRFRIKSAKTHKYGLKKRGEFGMQRQGEIEPHLFTFQGIRNG